MPSMRRMRVFAVVVLSAVIYILYLTSQARTARTPDFYSKTTKALEKDKGPLLHPHTPNKGIGIVEDDDEAIQEQLAAKAKEAEKLAKEPANVKGAAPDGPAPVEKAKLQAVVEDVKPDADEAEKSILGKNKQASDEKSEKLLEQDDGAESREVEQELNSILKRSPIIIFSKTYCPHSAKAKKILLENYSIIPAPYVVELDKHPLGAQIQAKLGETQGRRTVPNILIKGKSIGGGDEIVDLDSRMALVSTIKTMAGRQMQEVKKRQA